MLNIEGLLSQKPLRVWFWGPGSVHIEYLEPLGYRRARKDETNACNGPEAFAPFWRQIMSSMQPRGSNYPIFKASGRKPMKGMGVETRDLNIGYLDPLGSGLAAA